MTVVSTPQHLLDEAKHRLLPTISTTPGMAALENWLLNRDVHFEKHYDKQQAEVLTYLGYAFRAMNTHGRALFTLANRAIPPGRDAAYTIVDGERICTTVVGWNFGDGHLPTAQLIAALQRRCQFEPGQTRIVILDAQPIHHKTQQYRLVDAATGEFERGVIQVADLVSRQPWADDVPVRVCSATTTNF